MSSWSNWVRFSVTSVKYRYPMTHTSSDPAPGLAAQGIGYWFAANDGIYVNQKITNMSYMFSNSFSNPLDVDLSLWDTSSVLSMKGMFQNARAFNVDISNWDTSNVFNMYGMFDGAESFNQPIGSWDTSNVTNMDAMFYNAYAFNQDLSGWTTSLTAQPDAFSAYANSTWTANKATKFPFLSNGTTRINT